MSKHITYLDVDSVLADFLSASMSALGVTTYEITPGEYNLENWKGVNITTKEFWKKIDALGEDFWANIPIYDYSKDLVQLAKSYGEVYFLTSPARSPCCSSGKVRWIQRHFWNLRRNIIITPHKHLCAAPNRVLIDDSSLKIDKFKEYGGATIEFPQPYNRTWNEFTSPNSMWGDSKVNYVAFWLDGFKQNNLIK